MIILLWAALQLSILVPPVFASVVFQDCVSEDPSLLAMCSAETWTFTNKHRMRVAHTAQAIEPCLALGSAYDLYAVNIEGCGMRLPCFVTLGEETPVNLEFRADSEPRKLDQNVVININHINTRTNVTPELCNSELCPVRTDTLTSFYSVMSVPDNMALNQRGYLRWRVSNEQGVQVLCYSVLVQTQSLAQKKIRTSLGYVL